MESLLIIADQGEATVASTLHWFKNLPHLREASVSLHRYDAKLDLARVLDMAPRHVGANLIVEKRTALIDCVASAVFDIDAARAILKAGADPNLNVIGKRALNHCKTMGAMKFLLEEANADLVYMQSVGSHPPTWSLVWLLAELPHELKQYAVCCPVADRILAAGNVLLPPRTSVPDQIAAIIGTSGNDKLFRLLSEQGIMDRLGYSEADISGTVSHYISHAHAYPST